METANEQLQENEPKPTLDIINQKPPETPVSRLRLKNSPSVVDNLNDEQTLEKSFSEVKTFGFNLILYLKQSTVMEDLESTSEDLTKKKSEQEMVSWVLNRFKNKVKISRLSKAYERFIPKYKSKSHLLTQREFMEEIGKADIREVELGNSIVLEKTTIFMDVRGFTTMSEKVYYLCVSCLHFQIGSYHTFRFLNALSKRMLPIMRKYNGYVDKFIGDAIVSLYPTAG